MQRLPAEVVIDHVAHQRAALLQRGRVGVVVARHVEQRLPGRVQRSASALCPSSRDRTTLGHVSGNRVRLPGRVHRPTSWVERQAVAQIGQQMALEAAQDRAGLARRAQRRQRSLVTGVQPCVRVVPRQ